MSPARKKRETAAESIVRGLGEGSVSDGSSVNDRSRAPLCQICRKQYPIDTRPKTPLAVCEYRIVVVSRCHRNGARTISSILDRSLSPCGIIPIDLSDAFQKPNSATGRRPGMSENWIGIRKKMIENKPEQQSQENPKHPVEVLKERRKGRSNSPRMKMFFNETLSFL